MRLHIKKQTSDTIITQAYKQAENENDAIRNRISDFDKRRSSQPKTQIYMIAAVFQFVHPVEKDIKKHHKLTQNSVSFSCQSKQVSRCRINFPHELTCKF